MYVLWPTSYTLRTVYGISIYDSVVLWAAVGLSSCLILPIVGYSRTSQKFIITWSTCAILRDERVFSSGFSLLACAHFVSSHFLSFASWRIEPGGSSRYVAQVNKNWITWWCSIVWWLEKCFFVAWFQKYVPLQCWRQDCRLDTS